MGCDIHGFIMGCDIHGFIEYDSHGSASNFAVLDINRDYRLFSLLAGVRQYEGDDWKPPTPPKGIPQSLSWRTKDEATVRVSDKATGRDDDGRYVYTNAEVEKWRGPNYTAQWGEHVGIVNDENHAPNPDAHTPSWLDVSEVEQVLTRYERLVGHPHRELTAIHAMMTALDGDTVGRTRFVFWFDN